MTAFRFDPKQLEITQEKFDEIKHHAIEVSKLCVGHKSLPPAIIVAIRRWRDGAMSDIETGLMIVESDFSEADEKEQIMLQMGAKLRSMMAFPVAVFLTSEAWVSSRDPKDPKLHIMPRDDVNRKAAVVIQGRDLSGSRKTISFAEITRNAEETIQLGEFVHLPPDGPKPHTGLLDTLIRGVTDLDVKLNEAAFREEFDHGNNS